MSFNLRQFTGILILSALTAIVKLWIYIYFRKLSRNSQELCGNFMPYTLFPRAEFYDHFNQDR